MPRACPDDESEAVWAGVERILKAETLAKAEAPYPSGETRSMECTDGVAVAAGPCATAANRCSFEQQVGLARR